MTGFDAPQRIRYKRRVKGTWFIVLALALTADAADTGRGVTVEPVAAVAPGGNAGLFVGVNQFSKDTSLRPLNFAVNDAVAQAHLFVVELKLIPPANCYLSLAGEPTTESAKAQLAALLRGGAQRRDAAKPDCLRALLTVRGISQDTRDLLVVSFSSHGFERASVAYTMPSDGLHDVLEETAISLNTVEQQLARSKAGKRLLLVDACRENPVTDTRSVESAMSSAFRNALGAAEGQAVLASCDAGQLSIEDPNLGHGVFTHFLLKGLRGEAKADARGFITLGSASDYVAESVRVWVLRNKPGADPRLAQQPWFKGPKIAEQIPLAVDSGARARLSAFKAEIARMIDALKPKITGREFNYRLYDRLVKATEPMQDDAAGRKLLEWSKDFLTGKITEGAFAGFLESALGGTEPAKGEPGVNSLGMKFVPVRGAHVLFCIWKTRVQDFEAFVRATGYDATQGMFSLQADGWSPAGNTWKNPGFTQSPTHPVCGVSWEDAKAFCKWLTEKERADGRLQASQEYRLPTEAEWNAAVGTGKYPWGDQWPPPRNAGNYAGEESKAGAPVDWKTISGYNDGFARTSPVGNYNANTAGLFDIGGNLWEWCEDLYNRDSEEHVLRGASWYYDKPDRIQSSYRNKGDPGGRYDDIGFRCVLTPAK